MKTLYFSSTGNCLYVAKCLGGECLSIPKLIKQGTYEIKGIRFRANLLQVVIRKSISFL